MRTGLLVETYAGYPAWSVLTKEPVRLQDRSLMLPSHDGNIVAHNGVTVFTGVLLQELTEAELNHALLRYYVTHGGVEIVPNPLWVKRGCYAENLFYGMPQVRTMAHIAFGKGWAVVLKDRYKDVVSQAGLEAAVKQNIVLADHLLDRLKAFNALRVLLFKADKKVTIGEGVRPDYERYVMTFNPSTPDTAKTIAIALSEAGYIFTDLKPDTPLLTPNFWVEPLLLKSSSSSSE